MKEKIRKSKKSFTIHQVFSIILIVVLMIYTICLILPILWGVFTSVKSFEDFRVDPVYPPLRHIWQWEWKNFAVIFENFFVRTADFREVGMLEQIWYTILYAGIGSLIATFVPCIMAYVTARFNFRMSKVIYGIVLFAMILPVVGSFPSELNLMRALNLYDTMIGAWIQKANFLGIYFLVFHAFFKSLPNDYAEAAYVSGASEFRVMTSIMLPLARNIFATVMLIKFIELWNDYQSILLFMPSLPTLSYGLFYLSNNTQGSLNSVPMRMAGCMILVIPIMILFVLFRDRLFSNISSGGIKE